MIRTRTELVDFYVNRGHDKAIALALVDAVFSSHQGKSEGDLLWGWEFDSKEDQVVTLTEKQALWWWKAAHDQFAYEGEFITCFGDPLYHKDGTLIK